MCSEFSTRSKTTFTFSKSIATGSSVGSLNLYPKTTEIGNPSQSTATLSILCKKCRHSSTLPTQASESLFERHSAIARLFALVIELKLLAKVSQKSASRLGTA